MYSPSVKTIQPDSFHHLSNHHLTPIIYFSFPFLLFFSNAPPRFLLYRLQIEVDFFCLGRNTTRQKSEPNSLHSSRAVIEMIEITLDYGGDSHSTASLATVITSETWNGNGWNKTGGGNRLDYVTKARSYPILMLKSLRSSLYLGCLSASFCEPINRAARVDCNLTSTAYITSDCDGCSFSGASSNPRLQSQ